jgi:hypothetical protein
MRDWTGCQGRYRHAFQTIHGVSTYSENSPIAVAEPGVGRDKDELEHRFTLLRPEVLETLRQFQEVRNSKLDSILHARSIRTSGYRIPASRKISRF